MATQPVLSRATSGSNIGKQILNSKVGIDDSNGQLISSVSGGTSPFSVASGTVVSTLNVDQVDGFDASDLFNLDHASVSGILDTDHGGTNLDTSGSTGVPSISSGTWSVAALLALSLGGTGADLSATGPGALVQASGGAVVTVETLDETRGGTAQSTYTAGDMLYASGADTLAKLGIGSNGDVLTLAAGLPSWAAAGAPGAHASSHWENGGDEILVEALGTATLSTGSFLETDGTGGVKLSAGALPPVSSAQYSILVADASTGWTEDTGFKVNGGVVGTGTWQGTAVGATYGGTGINTSAATGVPYVSSGTWATESALDETRGGTGQSTITAGDLLYGSGANTLSKLAKGTSYQSLRMNVGATAPEWGTAMPLGGGTGLTGYTTGDLVYASGATAISKLGIGTADQFLRVNAGATAPEWDSINLDDLANVAVLTEAQGDILYYDGSDWNRLAAGTNGLFLKTQGAAANPVWADAGTGYTWTLAGDTGSETIADTNTGTFAGGNGISTAVTATDTCTITAVSDVTTGGNTAPVLVAANGLGLGVSALAGTGLAADGSAALDVDTGSTVDFSSDTPVWTFGNETTAEGLFVTGTPVDANHVPNKAYVDSVASGLTWKDPVYVKEYVGNAAALTIEGLSPTAGDAYVVSTANGVGALTTATVGDIWEYSGSAWALIIAGSGGFVPSGVRALASIQTALIAPLTDATDDGKIIEWDGTSLTGTEITTQGGWAVLVTDQDADGDSIYANLGYVFEGSVPTGTWVQFTGAGQINAGVGLTKSGNTLDIGAVANSAITLNADSIAIAVDDATIEVTAGSPGNINVKADGITTTEIDLSITPTWTGLHTFSHASGIATDVIGEETGGTGVTVDSCLIKDGIAAAADKVRNDDHDAAPGGGITAAQVCYVGTDKRLTQANATSAAGGFGSVVGVALNTAAQDNAVQLCTGGEVSVLCASGFTAGVDIDEGYAVYVGTTAGSVTPTPGVSVGNWVQEVGVITSMLTYNGSGDLTIQIEWAPKEASLIV